MIGAKLIRTCSFTDHETSQSFESVRDVLRRATVKHDNAQAPSAQARQVVDLGLGSSASTESNASSESSAIGETIAFAPSKLSVPWPSPKEDERRSPPSGTVIGDDGFGLEFVCDDSNADARDFDRGLQSAPLSRSQMKLLQQFTLGQLDAGHGAGCTLQQLSPDAHAPVIGSERSVTSGQSTAVVSTLIKLSISRSPISRVSAQGQPGAGTRRQPQALGGRKKRPRRGVNGKQSNTANTRSTPVKRASSKRRRR